MKIEAATNLSLSRFVEEDPELAFEVDKIFHSLFNGFELPEGLEFDQYEDWMLGYAVKSMLDRQKAARGYRGIDA